MSFSVNVKNELAHEKASKRCCRIAELSAIIRMDGSLHLQGEEKYALHLSMENAAITRRVLHFLRESFSLKSEVTIRYSKFHRAYNYLVFVPWQSRLNQVLNELGILDDSLNLRYDVVSWLVEQHCCGIAFLRGLFLGGGFVGNPRKAYHLELTTANYALAKGSAYLLARFGFKPKILNRGKNYTVYLKGSDQIGQFLTLIGAHNALLEWENIRIVKEMRAVANRLVNCDTANLNKAVGAALEQLRDISFIDQEIGVEHLPRRLQEVARARISYPQVSLKELGEACQPPLSKSAVYHRILRLKALAESLKDRHLTSGIQHR